MIHETKANVQRTQITYTPRPSGPARIDVVSDGTAPPKTLHVHRDKVGHVVADYAGRSWCIEVIAHIDGEAVVTPGPRARDYVAACRRARIVEAATANRTGGMALLTALVDTSHQRQLVDDLGAALFPEGGQVTA